MVLLFLGLQKNKPNRRAQGLCFCFFGAVRKNKSNRRAQGLYFWFLWGFQKKQIQYEGRDWRERLLERNKQSTCRRFASGSSLRFVRFGSLFYTLAVRFGSVSQLPVSGRFPVRAVRFPVRGSVREPSWRTGFTNTLPTFADLCFVLIRVKISATDWRALA